MLQNFEKRFIFPFAKAISTILVVVVVIYLAILLKPESIKTVSYEDVKKSSVIDKEEVSKGTGNQLAKNTIETIEKYNPQEKERLINGVSQIVSGIDQDNRRHFENGLVDVLNSLMKDKDPEVMKRSGEILQSYVDSQLREYESKKQQTGIDKIVKTVSASLAALIFILLVSLLALLEIEKNTRKAGEK